MEPPKDTGTSNQTPQEVETPTQPESKTRLEEFKTLMDIIFDNIRKRFPDKETWEKNKESRKGIVFDDEGIVFRLPSPMDGVVRKGQFISKYISIAKRHDGKTYEWYTDEEYGSRLRKTHLTILGNEIIYTSSLEDEDHSHPPNTRILRIPGEINLCLSEPISIIKPIADKILQSR
ncbi:MAG: hypothetical protein ABH812_02815 [bacterium]